MLNGYLHLFGRVFLHWTCFVNLQIAILLVLPIPSFKRVLCRVAQLANDRCKALSELDVELDGPNSIFVSIHELPPSSPSFGPHPHCVNSAQYSTVLQNHELTRLIRASVSDGFWAANFIIYAQLY